VWVPQLGGIEIEQEQDHVIIRYPIPRAWRAADHAGLFPSKN
jgi:hypothetical protein